VIVIVHDEAEHMVVIVKDEAQHMMVVVYDEAKHMVAGRAGHNFQCPLISPLSLVYRNAVLIFHFENINLLEERLFFLNFQKASAIKILFCRIFKNLMLSMLLFFVNCPLKLSCTVCVPVPVRLCPCPSV
jgi:hypothetical protein